jgi:hypothetical protein
VKRVAAGALLVALTLGPGIARAQTAPNFACETRSLIVGAAEVNGLRVHCAVSGAAGDQVLRILGDQPRPVCEVTLSDGSGDCGGALFGSPGVGHLVAVLVPSGTQFDVLAQQPLEGDALLQYTPIAPQPEDSSSPGAP